MKTKMLRSAMGAAVLVGLLWTGAAHATAISWTQWSGTPTGSMAVSPTPVTVSYTGAPASVGANYPSWKPTTTFADGIVVNNAPPQSSGIVLLVGGDATIDTITFSRAVTNPVMAIWSLGGGTVTAQFNFTSPFTIVAVGPSVEYAGQGITSSGNIVYGVEGNGTIQFNGTFSSISWTNPVIENSYGFTVGVPDSDTVPDPDTVTDPGTVTEPDSLPLYPANGHYYERVQPGSGLTWDQAKLAAQSRSYLGVSGHLATITDVGESTFIDNHLTTSGGWLGGYQLDGNTAPDVGWQWVTNEPWEFTNWVPGEPNDWSGYQENRLCFLGGPMWNDTTAVHREAAYIVEYDTAIPEPASLLTMTLLGCVGLIRHRRRNLVVA